MPRLTPLLLALLTPLTAGAAGVAVSNRTDRPVSVTLSHPGKPGQPVTLAPGEARLFPVGRQPEISYKVGAKAGRFRLEPYQAYMFSADRQGVEFHGIDLAGAMPRPDDVPADPPAAAPVRLDVALYADDANPRSREGWERAYRARLAAASEVLARQCGVTLAVASVGDWRSDPSGGDLVKQAKVFEAAAPVTGDALAVGFTSRFPRGQEQGTDLPTGFARAPLWPHLLVRDGHLRTETEKVEAVVREVGHYLGAAHTPDPFSAMRGNPADGRGVAGRYPVGLDPLNLLAVGIWADELRAGKPKSFADLRPASRERLAVVYKTLSGALPTDELAAEHLAALERVGEGARAAPPPAKADPPPAPKVEPPKPAEQPKVAPPAAKPVEQPKVALPKVDPPPPPKVEPPKVEVPKPAEPPKAVMPVAPPPVKEPPKEEPKPVDPPKVDRTEAIRRVVQAVRLRAVDLKREPDADKAKGDQLTVELLMAAGDIAYSLDGPVRAPAFLIGIGIALDDSEVLRKNVLVGGLVRSVETDAERAERVAALGTPTVRGRRDLLQHFAVSAALAELIGPAQAEAVGLLKEMADRDGVTGFSFADLQADLAGIQLAKALNKFPEAIGRFREGVFLNDYVPPHDGLREGLTAAKFAEAYGGPDDPRFKAELAAVRKRVTDMPKYKEIEQFNPPR